MEGEERELGKLATPALATWLVAVILLGLGAWEKLSHTPLYYLGLLIGLGGWVACYLRALYIGFRDRDSIEPRTVASLLVGWVATGFMLFPGEPSGTLLRYMIEILERGYWECAPGQVFFGWICFLAITLALSMLWEKLGKPTRERRSKTEGS